MLENHVFIQVYQQLDKMQDELKSLERKKTQVKRKREDLERQLRLESELNESVRMQRDGKFYELLSLFDDGKREREALRQKERKEEIERQISDTRKEWSNLCEKERLLPKEIAKLKKILEKLEDLNTHEKKGYNHGYEVGYRNKGEGMQIAAYRLLEPPDNILLQDSYKSRNEIIRRCRQYYEDGYKRGKRIGQSERREIMGE